MKAFDKIIGYEAIKKELLQISDVLADDEAYKKLGVTPPCGLLLHGVPGVGKTLMATAVIAASGRKAFICRKDKPNGDFIKSIKKTFSDAEAAAPSIVFLDDMDKFANADANHPDAEEYVTVQSCIDAVKGKDVFVLATANNIRPLPDSLLRAGRFDRIIEVENPRGDDAVRIISHYINKKKFVGGIEAEAVARIMDGHSCAELETIINEAGLYAGFDRSDVITMDHFMKACLHLVYNVPIEMLNAALPDTDLADGDDVRARVVYHEAGHAAVSEVLDPGSVTLISAYSKEYSTGGFTSYCKVGDKKTVEGVYGRVCCALGGVAAVDQIFGVRDSGAASDVGSAYNMVENSVTRNCTCGFGLFGDPYDSSQEKQAKQEQSIHSELERLYLKTKEILAANRELLDAIAAELSAKGVLTAADVARITREHPPAHVAVA